MIQFIFSYNYYIYVFGQLSLFLNVDFKKLHSTHFLTAWNRKIIIDYVLRYARKIINDVFAIAVMYLMIFDIYLNEKN